MIIVSWLLADFLSGLIHWWQDIYLHPYKNPWLLRIMGRDNMVHHWYPDLFTTLAPWTSIILPALYTWPFCALALYLGAHWFWPVTIFILTWTNWFHYWVHCEEARVPGWIKLLQRSYLMLPRAQHDMHHESEGLVNTKTESVIGYCVITGFWNPILTKLKFWERLVWALSKIGIKPTENL